MTLGDDDDYTSWDTEPSPAHPHVALLLGGSLLTVVLVCVLPLLVIRSVRPGWAEMGLVVTVLVAAACGLGPFVSSRLQTLRYVLCALLVFDVLPLAVVSVLPPETPARQWCSLLLIPVLLSAATMSRRYYQAQLAAGCVVGLTIMVVDEKGLGEAVLTCVGYLFFMLVCASLTRQDWAALHARFEELKRRSHTDELTGLLNRRGFVAQFPDVRRDALAGAAPLGMVMIDIDHFSRINAVYGHAYGDSVLQRMCSVVLRHPLISEGRVARIGGEELVVVAPHPAGPIAEAIRQAINDADLHPGLTVSMGISDFDPERCTGAEALWRLVNLTDTAMYRAKQAGRDRIVRVAAEQAEQPSAPESDGWPTRRIGPFGASDGVGLPPVPRPPEPAAGQVGEAVHDSPMDYRLFGAFCLVFAGIGAVAFALRVAIDRDSAWAPVFLGFVGLVAVAGLIAVHQGRALNRVAATATFLTFELCTIAAVLATAELEHRLMIICVITVPVLIAAHSVSRRWLVSQYVLVFVGCGLAAHQPGVPLDATWTHRTLSLAVVISAAPAVLFWLRGRRALANGRLRLLTATDPLTGVRNRIGLERAVRGERIHVLSVNIDGFKALNDTFGHVYGDQALAHLAHALSVTAAEHDRTGTARAGSVRETVVGRTGGDRFVVVTDGPADPSLVRRIRAATGSVPVELSLSFGEAEGTVLSPTAWWMLVAAADADLARSKLER